MRRASSRDDILTFSLKDPNAFESNEPDDDDHDDEVRDTVVSRASVLSLERGGSVRGSLITKMRDAADGLTSRMKGRRKNRQGGMQMDPKQKAVLEKMVSEKKINLSQLQSNSQRRLLINGPVLKEGKLDKQGHFFRTWHTRHFVLTSKGLDYYESKRRYMNGSDPFGSILFCDVESEGGEAVNEVPNHLVRKLRLATKRNLFCLHLPNTTYVMSARSKEEKDEWVSAIEDAYNKYISKSFHASKKVMRIHQNDRKSGKFFDACKSVMDLDSLFEAQLAQLRREFELKRVFYAWQTFRTYQKNHPPWK